MSFALSAFGQTSEPIHSEIRPCTNDEWQIAFSPEAKQLTEAELKTMGGFSWCESAKVPFLPHSHILRLHSPVDVDYSYTATLLQTRDSGPLRLVSSGRGMVGLPPLDAANSIAGLNFLLSGTALKFDKDTVKAVSDLYLFILDSRGSFGFMGPNLSQPHSVEDEAFKTVVAITPRSANVTYPGNPWQLTFVSSGSILQLQSVAIAKP